MGGRSRINCATKNKQAWMNISIYMASYHKAQSSQIRQRLAFLCHRLDVSSATDGLTSQQVMRTIIVLFNDRDPCVTGSEAGTTKFKNTHDVHILLHSCRRNVATLEDESLTSHSFQFHCFQLRVVRSQNSAVNIANERDIPMFMNDLESFKLRPLS